MVECIGKFSDEGRLYFRRNAAIHAIWLTTADGQEVGHRVGHTAQDQTSPADLDALLVKIIKVGQELLEIAYPLIASGQSVAEVCLAAVERANASI
jgi:hypothetical protein